MLTLHMYLFYEPFTGFVFVWLVQRHQSPDQTVYFRFNVFKSRSQVQETVIVATLETYIGLLIYHTKAVPFSLGN